MTRRQLTAVLAACLMLTVQAARVAHALAITHVSAEPSVIEPAPGASVSVVFQLSAPASVSLQLYDGRDLLIRRVASTGTLPAGDQRLTWDLRDQAGRAVPAEAYRYTLTAISPQGDRVEHDRTDLTAGDDLTTTAVAWDPQTKTIAYRLPQPARVNIRVGLANNGPLLVTVLDWVTRDAGLHRESWNGLDTSAVLDLSRHPRLKIVVNAFALSDNSILVGPASDQVALITDLSWGEERRTIKRTDRKRMHFHRQQALEDRSDYRITLTLPPDLPTTADGLPIVSGIVPLRLDVSDQDRARVVARRFEPVFFVDGTFAFENEVGFLPMTWRWDSAGANPGIHFLTVNLRGYEGNFGMATLKVRVRQDGDNTDSPPSSGGLAE